MEVSGPAATSLTSADGPQTESAVLPEPPQALHHLVTPLAGHVKQREGNREETLKFVICLRLSIHCGHWKMTVGWSPACRGLILLWDVQRPSTFTAITCYFLAANADGNYGPTLVLEGRHSQAGQMSGILLVLETLDLCAKSFGPNTPDLYSFGALRPYTVL
eukprot:4907680-Amphidinium_carterae.2